MRVRSIMLCLIAVAFSGCFGEEGGDDRATLTPDETGPRRTDLLPYEVDPASANESELEGTHDHDKWGPLHVLTLFQGTAKTTECGSFAGNVLDTLESMRDESEVHSGCAAWRFGAGVVVPEGTDRLTVWVDASEALKEGQMQLWYRNAQRDFAPYQEPVAGPENEWAIDVDVREWDVPHAEETTWSFELRPSGQAAVLDGVVKVLAVAYRIQDWVPPLGSAHADHWGPGADHLFVAPGVMQILSTDVKLAQPSYVAQAAGAEAGQPVPLDDIVPPGGTVAVAAVVRYDDGVAGCPPGHECFVRPALNPIGSRVLYLPDVVRDQPTYALFLWTVPEPVVPDSTYVTESAYQLLVDIGGCPDGQDLGFGRVDGCQAGLAADLSADVAILMEAHLEAFDENGIAQRAGV